MAGGKTKRKLGAREKEVQIVIRAIGRGDLHHVCGESAACWAPRWRVKWMCTVVGEGRADGGGLISLFLCNLRFFLLEHL